MHNKIALYLFLKQGMFNIFNFNAYQSYLELSASD